MALNAKQNRFVEEYPVDLNATQAAIRAGYSKKTAYSIGQRLLKDVEIQEAIQKAMKDGSERTGITQDKVVEELGKVAFAEAHDYTDADLKYGNKLKALELLGKHLGMFEKRDSYDVEDVGEAREEVFGDG